MRAPVQMQKQLLELQKIDIQIAKVNHLLKTMPVNKEIAEVEAKLEKVDAINLAGKAKYKQLEDQVKQAHDHIQELFERIQKQENRSKDSSVSPKEIQAILHEIKQMEKRYADLEEQKNKLIDAAEHVNTQLEKVADKKAELLALKQELEDKKISTGEKLLQDKTQYEQQRQQVADTISPQLLQLYTDTRKATGGIAVVAMKNGVTLDIALEFSVAEMDKIRRTPQDEIVIAQDYDYILVRLEE